MFLLPLPGQPRKSRAFARDSLPLADVRQAQILRRPRRYGVGPYGRFTSPEFVPYPVNQEVFRAFQLDSGLDIDALTAEIAGRFAGPKFAPALIEGWRNVEAAIRKFMPMSLYSGFGSVWNRLLVRPLVPDIDRIPEADRAYYEAVMVSPPHNPNRVDLGKDVLFDLIPKTYAGTAYRRIDAGVWKPLNAAVRLFRENARKASESGDEAARRLFEDQGVRAEALQGHYTTLRNAAVWIFAVHEFLGTRNARVKARCRKLLDEAIGREIENARMMIRLWEETDVVWMMASPLGETPFIHGMNYPDLLQKRSNSWSGTGKTGRSSIRSICSGSPGIPI